MPSRQDYPSCPTGNSVACPRSRARTARGDALPARLVVLASGSGTTLQALLDAGRDDDYGARVVAVGSDKPQSRALSRARDAEVPAVAVALEDSPDRGQWNLDLADAVAAHEPDLVVLAGFMRILTAGFVEHYAGRLLNIHPSLLPLYPGLHTHEAVLAAGDARHGATVHFVTAQLDHGPVVGRAEIDVLPGDTPDTLAQRLLKEEHKLYPYAVRLFVEGRLTIVGDDVIIADAPASAGTA